MFHPSSIDCVHMMAGAFILIGVALGAWVNIYCLIIPLFVAVNLFQYGFTDFCPAEAIFLRMGFSDIRCPYGREKLQSCGCITLTRQSAVHIMAGVLTGLGLGLGLWVNPYCWIISAFVGANLFQFGISGFCPAVLFFKLTGLPDVSCDIQVGSTVTNPKFVQVTPPPPPAMDTIQVNSPQEQV